jgi:hypothetical protein
MRTHTNTNNDTAPLSWRPNAWLKAAGNRKFSETARSAGRPRAQTRGGSVNAFKMAIREMLTDAGNSPTDNIFPSRSGGEP